MKTTRECFYYDKERTRTIPPLDIYETAEFLIFELDLPGISPDDVQIKVYEDIVVFEGIKSDKDKGKGYRYICVERTYDAFKRMVKLPVSVNTIAGKATYTDGVVRLTFPKVQNRVIQIRIEKE